MKSNQKFYTLATQNMYLYKTSCSQSYLSISFNLPTALDKFDILSTLDKPSSFEIVSTED